MKNWVWVVLVAAVALIIMNVASSINSDKTPPSTPASSTSVPPQAEPSTPPPSPSEQ